MFLGKSKKIGERVMKKILLWGMVTLLCLMLAGFSVLAGCKEETATGEALEEAPEVVEEVGEEETDKESVKFVYATDIMDPWDTDHADEITRQAEDRGWELFLYNAEYDLERKISQMEEAITINPDVMGVLITDDVGLGPPIQKVAEAGIPVVGMAGILEEEYRPYLTASVIGSSYHQGEAAAELVYQGLVELYGEDLDGIQGTVLQGLWEMLLSKERDEGFKTKIEELIPGVTILDSQIATWEKGKALDITETWLATYDKIDFIFAANDGMALGAVEAVDAGGKLDSTIIVGVDGVNDALLEIKAGRLYGTVAYSPVNAAAAVVATAEKIVNGEEVEFLNILPNPKIWAENVDEFLSE